MKNIKKLHVISFVFIIIFVLGMVATGWYGLPVYSFDYLKHGVGDLFTGRFASGSMGQLISAIVFIVATVALLVLLILIIVRAVKKNKKQVLPVAIVTIVLTWIVLAFAYVIYTASIGWNGESVINENFKRAFADLFSPQSGTAAHLRAAFNIASMILAIEFFVMQFVAAFKELKYIESEQVGDAEVEVLTEDEMREIIREELVAFYQANPTAVATTEEPVAVVAPVEEVAAEEEAPAEEVAAEEETPVEEVVEEVVVAEEAPVEEVVEEVAAEEVAEEEAVTEEPVAVVEEPVVEETFERQEATTAVDVNNNGRISFYERIVSLDQELLDDYNELKNELVSYGLKSRVSSTGDTFRLHRVTYCKMIFSGKKVKLFLKLNPADYKDSTIPFDDISHKKSYAEIPFVFKVKSGLSLRRAKALIKEMMDNNGIIQESEPKKVKYAEMLIKDIKEGNVQL